MSVHDHQLRSKHHPQGQHAFRLIREKREGQPEVSAAPGTHVGRDTAADAEIHPQDPLGSGLPAF